MSAEIFPMSLQPRLWAIPIQPITAASGSRLVASTLPRP